MHMFRRNGGNDREGFAKCGCRNGGGRDAPMPGGRGLRVVHDDDPGNAG